MLAVLFVATAAGAVVYVSIQSSRDGRADAEHDARFAARTAAGQLGNGIAVLRATVAQLAANPRVSDAFTRPEECTLAFAGPDGVETGHIDIVRSDGAVACSSRPRKGGAPLAGYRGEAWLARARTRPLLAAPVVDRAAGGNAVLSAAPIRGGVVAAFLALEPAGPGLARLFGGGRPAEFIVTSRDGRVLARSIDPAAGSAPRSQTPASAPRAIGCSATTSTGRAGCTRTRACRASGGRSPSARRRTPRSRTPIACVTGSC